MIRARLRRQLEEVARGPQAANQVRQKPNQRLVDNGARRRPFLCQTGGRIRQSFILGWMFVWQSARRYRGSYLDALARPVDEPQSHSTHCKIPILCNAWRPGTVNVTTLAITAARAIAVSMMEARSMAGRIRPMGLGPMNDDADGCAGSEFLTPHASRSAPPTSGINAAW
jgi:hypothetical protein